MQQTVNERLELAMKATRQSALLSGAETDPESDKFKAHLDLMRSVLGCKTGVLTHPLIFNMALCDSKMNAEYRTAIRASLRGIVPEAAHISAILKWWWKSVNKDVSAIRGQRVEKREKYAWEQHDFLMSHEAFAEANDRTARLVYYMFVVSLGLRVKIIKANKAIAYGERQRDYRRDKFIPLMKKKRYL